MAKALCIQCAQEFDSDELFQKHKKSGHKTPGTPLATPDIPTEAQPTPEFMEAIARIESKEEPKDESVAEPLEEHPKRELPPAKPIVLQYVYTGDCPECRNPITTLEMEVDDKHFIVAYCVRENKQLASRQEKKL